MKESEIQIHNESITQKDITQQGANIQNIQNRISLEVAKEEKVTSATRIVKNEKGQIIEGQVEITHEKNALVQFIAGGKSQSYFINEKTTVNQYSKLNLDDPEIFDGTIKCVRLKCIVYGIITAIVNFIRLLYLIFLHLGYPAIIWAVRFACSCYYWSCCCFLDDSETKVIESETGLERIDYERGKIAKGCSLCAECAKAFWKFLLNFIYCPCWFYHLCEDCIYDIKNRALDNARTGCYKFIHYDCGFYEKFVEDPFNNYRKKRHIILTTDPDDSGVIYGDACKDNTII